MTTFHEASEALYAEIEKECVDAHAVWARGVREDFERDPDNEDGSRETHAAQGAWELALARQRAAESEILSLRGWQALADMRRNGWSVAVHNDYRLNGEQWTFWLFTKGNQAVKGEGMTDAFAIFNAASEAARLDS